jgi:hypothetical protein
MSFVLVSPEVLAAASAELSGLRAALRAAHAAALVSTTGLAAAGADEVSADIARVFGTYGNQFQQMSVQAESFHARFVAALNGAQVAYGSEESASASPLVSDGPGPY